MFKSIAGFTDNSIDKVEALRSAIQIKTLGIGNSTKDIGELIARAGTASKLAGMDSAEGIKKFTQFLKDGSIANLEFLNLIKSNDPALKLQMSMIGKMGGVLGGAMTAQMKYGLGLKLLRAATDGQLKGQRDLYDVVSESKQAFSLLKNEIGIFLGTALSSVLNKITKVVDAFSSMLEYIRTTKKEILFLAKSVTVATAAFAGFMATVGTIRLAALGLKALGISTAPIILGATVLLSVFTALTHKIKEGATPIERLVNKLQLFSAVLKGTYQLVSSLITNQDNMTKGIGKMDKELYELLNNNGLFVFVHEASKKLAILALFAKEVFKELVSWAKTLDETFGSLTNKVAEIFGVNKKIDVNLDATGNVIDEPAVKRASRFWLDANSKAYGFLKKGAAAVLAAYAAYKMLSIGKGFLSNLPILGRLFKGNKTGKPDGTKTNPIHVVMDKLFGNLLKDSIINNSLGKSPSLPVPTAGKNVGRTSGIMTKLGSSVRSAVAGIWMTFVPFIRSSTFLSKVFTGLVGTLDKVKTALFGIKNIELGVLFRSLFARTWIAVASKIATVKDAISGVITSFTGLSKGAAALRGFQIVHIVLAAAGALAGTIAGIQDLFSSFSGVIGAAYNYLRAIDYSKVFQDLYQSVAQTLTEVATWVTATFNTLYDVVASALEAAMAPVKKIGIYIVEELIAAFAILKPLVTMAMKPIAFAFDTVKTWFDLLAKALAGFYTKLTEIPVIGPAIKAFVDSTTDPVGTMYAGAKEGLGAASAGLDMIKDSINLGTAQMFLDQAKGGKGKLAIDPENLKSEDRMVIAKDAIELASGAQKQQMSSAYRQAMNDSDTPNHITAEEFAQIFGFALDNSKIAKHTKETAVEIKDKKTDIQPKRGGC